MTQLPSDIHRKGMLRVGAEMYKEIETFEHNHSASKIYLFSFNIRTNTIT